MILGNKNRGFANKSGLTHLFYAQLYHNKHSSGVIILAIRLHGGYN
jgi:hypothetical protein